MNTVVSTISHYGFSAFVFVATILIVVTIHELGHFLVARWCGIRVDVFSIGMGRELLGFTDRHGTRWKLALFPIGGYVKFFGDEDASSIRERSDLTAAERETTFAAKPLTQRAAVVVAGPLANLLMAVLIIAGFDMGFGKGTIPAVIASVMPDSAAASAGLRTGDRVTAVNGEAVASFGELRRMIVLYGTAGEMTLTLERAGKPTVAVVRPKMVTLDGRQMPQVGITADTQQMDVTRLGPLAALQDGVRECYGMVSSSLIAIGQMFQGTRSTRELGGPVGIAQASAQAAATGVWGWVSFVALLSVNLGFINLLPIPILDGGHLLIFAIEGVSRRNLSNKVKEIGFGLGLFTLFAVMILATWNDILRIVQG